MDNTDSNSDSADSVANPINDVGQNTDGVNGLTDTQSTDESGGGSIGLEGVLVFLFALRWLISRNLRAWKGAKAS